MNRPTWKVIGSAALLMSVASAACLKPPATPTPKPTIQQVTIVTQPAVTGCDYTATSTDPKVAWSLMQPAVADASAVFGQVPWLVQSVHASVHCAGYLDAAGDATTAGDGHTTITVQLTAAVKPLPRPPTRDELANVHACFQGVYATTSDSGRVPSWGPDAWMHAKVEDRMAVYNAHKVAGCKFITVALGPKGEGYREGGVAYPNGQASGNFFDDNDFTTLCQVTAEIVRNDMFPLMAIGGDNAGPEFGYIYANLPGVNTALQGCKDGNLKPYVNFLLGFDSVDELAQADGANIDQMILFVRQTLGPDAVISKENQTGWAFWSGCRLNGGGPYSCDAARAIDTILQEFASPPGPPAAVPGITGGQFDPDHGSATNPSYIPIWTDDALATAFQQIWQVAGRTVLNWVNPPDEPLSVTTTLHGGPLDGQQGSVGADSARPPTYTAQGTPRGRYYVVAYEYFTYLWVRDAVSVADIIKAGDYLKNAGYDQSAGPASATNTKVDAAAAAWLKKLKADIANHVKRVPA